MSEKKQLYRQSETITIKRSQINFAPYNPKKHTKDKIDQIRKNFKRVGFLGGIIWNEATSNLIDGHKRVSVLDIIHKYNGNSETDYNIKVEKIALDEKTEKEQNIFQTESRTELDLELMQSLIPEIDYQNAGLNLEDINYYMPNIPIYEDSLFVEINNDFKALESKTDEQRSAEKEARKQKVIEAKQKVKNTIKEEIEQEPYVTLTFTDFENKAYFMELLGENVTNRYVQGEKILEMIN